MRRGEYINGYLVLQDFTTAGGGLSKWTFAERQGRQYFLKEFLRPVYPLPDSPGSPVVKEMKKRECDEFELHQKSLKDAIATANATGGNLISTLDFFRWASKYYKVTEKVDVTTLKPAQIAGLPINQRLLIMTTVAHSLRILHSREIVHNDLKLDNVLIKKTRTGSYTSKLIDFDSSYFSGRPPGNAEEVIGDIVFYSPELARYIQQIPGTEAHDLTIRSDIFSLGLLYCLYLTGELPAFDKQKYRYACIAANNGHELRISPQSGISSDIEDLIHLMLALDPEHRPRIDEIFTHLRDQVKVPDPDAIAAAGEEASRASGGELSAMLKKRLEAMRGDSTGKTNADEDAANRLKGSLLKKK